MVIFENLFAAMNRAVAETRGGTVTIAADRDAIGHGDHEPAHEGQDTAESHTCQLWAEAYSFVRGRHKRLVQRFEDAMTAGLRDRNETGGTSDSMYPRILRMLYLLSTC